MKPVLHSKIIGKGVPLLILHGLLGTGDNWITLGRRYASQGFGVHLIDLRNHGKSFHADEMNYEVMMQDLLHYINIYKLSAVRLLGHSMGGKTAMYLAVHHPAAVHKLIVVDIAPKAYPPHHHFIFEAIEKTDLSRFKKRSEINDFLSEYIKTPAIRNFLLKNLTRDKDGNFIWKPNIPVLQSSLDELGEALPPYSVFDQPALFVKGEKSPYINSRDDTLIKAHFPQASLKTVPAAGHWVHAEQPDIFFNETLNFLLNK